MENKADYYRILHELESFSNENIKVYGTSRSKLDIRLEVDKSLDEDLEDDGDIIDEEIVDEGNDDV